jgi:hypothetical protein
VCTVSYIALENGFVLTSNRDETSSRPTLVPAEYNINGLCLIFPKDELAEGSWIACDKNGQVSCLLNGAFKKHKRSLPYGRSRGKVLLESFNFKDISTFITMVNLSDVEPFTLIIVKNDALNELKWDGVKKHVKYLDATKNHLWSSATLYPSNVTHKKEIWFTNWVKKHAGDNQKNILKFHCTRHGNIPSEDVNSQFKGDLRTVSITQVKNLDNKGIMEYHDLINESIDRVTFNNILCHE